MGKKWVDIPTVIYVNSKNGWNKTKEFGDVLIREPQKGLLSNEKTLIGWVSESDKLECEAGGCLCVYVTVKAVKRLNRLLKNLHRCFRAQ